MQGSNQAQYENDGRPYWFEDEMTRDERREYLRWLAETSRTMKAELRKEERCQQIAIRQWP